MSQALRLDGQALLEVTMEEERVLRRMKRQHGLISRSQALRCGMTAAQIQRRLRSGRWLREARGVYRHAVVPSTPLSRLLAVCIAYDALASHRAAAALHAIDGYRLGRSEVLVPAGRGLVLRDVIVHESSQMELARPVVRQGIPCTGPPRTLLDLAAVVSRKRLDRTIDAVLRDRLLRPSDLYGVLAGHACRGRRGIAVFRAALDGRLGDDPVPLSEWSRMVEDLLVGAGLARPRLEYRICTSDGALLAQVDLAYPVHRVAIELDSVRYHLNRESFVSDARRRNQLNLAGWTVLSFTWDDYISQPGDMCMQVEAACARPSANFLEFSSHVTQNSRKFGKEERGKGGA
jgi:hypothetical protein